MSTGDKKEPLTPTGCDLRDFPFMQIEVQRLLTSETWILGNAEERSAAIALWLTCWHQVPAASLPNNDKVLAHLSMAGAKWSKVRVHALRGWIDCSDGRLYHPVIAEKALAAWIEKLRTSISGMHGNAKRWNASVDTSGQDAMLFDAIERLKRLAPQSPALKKKSAVTAKKPSPPDRPSNPIAIADESLSDRNREGEGERESTPKPPPGSGMMDSACAGKPEPPDSRTAEPPGTPHSEAENPPPPMAGYQHLPDENGDFLGPNPPAKKLNDDPENADFSLEKWSKKPTLVGQVSAAMRQEGLANVGQGDLRFLEFVKLVKTGELSIDTFTEAARTAVENGGNFQYALKIIENQLTGAQRLAEKITAQRSSKMTDILAGAI